LFEFARRTTPMLVLSRKPGEKIHVGSGITITVVRIQGNRVRLGIDAPADVPLVRAELNGLPGRSAAEPPLPRPPPGVADPGKG
jgi:carbon storage regulator